MAFLDVLNTEIADLKARLDRLEERYQAEKGKLQARLAALKTAKQAFRDGIGVEAACEAAGVELKI
jgi:hypothetical protein